MRSKTKYSQEEIDTFIKRKTGIKRLGLNDDLSNDHGVCGDDFRELLEAYANAFDVDMQSYRWYFHAEEEGSWNSIGGLFFKPPNKRVPYIPVTPALLLYFANEGRWTLQYPPHELPNRRWDIIINQILFVLASAGLIYSCLK